MKIVNSYKITSIILFIAISLACIMGTIFSYAYMMNNIILDRFIQTATNTNNYYYTEIVSQNLKGFDIINKKDQHEWKHNEEYLKLVVRSMKFLLGTEAVNINLRNIYGVVILSLDPLQVTQASPNKVSQSTNLSYYLNELSSLFYPKQFASISFEKSLLGATGATIMPDAIFRNSENYLTNGIIAKVIMPIIDQSKSNADNPILGVIEYYYDITDSCTKAKQIALISLLIIGILIFIFIIHIRAIFNRFQIVINSMLDVNNELTQKKNEAQNETNQKTIFLSTISHEMKTPLSSIINYSEDMMLEQNGPINNPIYKQYIEDINNIGQYTLSLVKDILDYARASGKQLTIESTCFDVRKMLIFSARIVEQRAQQSGLKLILDLCTMSIPILADQKRFKQCILNILTNSIKYTPAGGEIKISADIDRSMKYDQVKIICQDNGIGIDPKNLTRAVENFEKIEEVKLTKYEGTGLGLPFTKKLVELMGGKFEIESDLGKGTKITFTFKYQDHIN